MSVRFQSVLSLAAIVVLVVGYAPANLGSPA
jgi:hypothetical protein